MKIVHHANYVKWMEEARLQFFHEAGFNWKRLDEAGIMIPVLFQSVEYHKRISFDEVVEIECMCDKFNGVKMNFKYSFYTDNRNTLNAIGITKHGFINSDFIPVNLKEYYPNEYEALNRVVNLS